MDHEIPQTKPQEKEYPFQEWYNWLQTLLSAILCIVLAFTFLGRVTRVVGSSMVPTLHEGELLVVWSLGYQPKQGDIVIANKNDTQTSSLLHGDAIVKRVIATEGQTVQLDYDYGHVYVDGERLEEDYILEDIRWLGDPEMQQTYFEVPEGSVFLMGDNRNGSTDSRHDRVGPVDEGYLLGKAVFVLFPFSEFGFL